MSNSAEGTNVLMLVFALALQAPMFQYPSCSGTDNWKFTLNPVALERGPRWRDADAAPPLPPRAAIRAAREFLRRSGCEQADAWELTQVALQPIAAVRDRWVYLVEFAEPLRLPTAPVGSVLRRVTTVVVLLDGTVVAPSTGRKKTGN